MFRFLRKAFVRKPDLTLEFTEKSFEIAKYVDGLMKQGFTFHEWKNDGTNNELSAAERDPISNRSLLRVEMQVSRERLTEASIFFEVLLNGSFREAGQQRVQMSTDYIDMFALLMSIVHKHTRLVMTQNIDAEIIFQLCIIVDKRALHSNAAPCMNFWYCKLKPKNSSPFGFPRWLFITHVLRKEDYFKLLTEWGQWQRIPHYLFDKVPQADWIQGGHLEVRNAKENANNHEDTMEQNRREALQLCSKSL